MDQLWNMKKMINTQKEDIGGGVNSLEVKQGVQDIKISKPELSHVKKRKRMVAE